MKPTVLIGLGGIGSQTVDKIYSMMDESQRKNTATAVLDTDVGDLQKLESIEVKIQTSPDVKVGNYVYEHQEIMEWFPYEYAKINDMMLSDGAGQIRALSRLSFYSALERGAIFALDKAIEKLSLLNDSVYTNDVNVVTVGTIAGGTGSGSFIQMGLYMRKYFAEKNPNASIFIQGVFLLPDTITKTGSMVQSEWENVQFNAYAALKELNAILSPKVVKNVNIELEYRPGVDPKMNYDNRPYDNILFFDYENSSNQHLESLDQYKLLLAETIYYAYISPISSDYQSRFVNQIRTFIQNHQESFYSASSVNKLIYPYADIAEYLSLEWIIDEIDTEWLQFDKQHHENMRQYKLNLKNGVNSPKPDMGDTYIDGLDRMEGKQKTAFYTSVFNQTRVLDEESGDILNRRDTLFVSEVEDYVRKSLYEDKDFIKYKSRCEIQPMLLDDIDNAQGHIIELENYLKVFEKNIDKTIHKHKNILLRDIVTKHCDEDVIKTENKYNINYWLLSEKNAMHPVSVRYFLYRSRRELTKKLNDLEEKTDKTKRFVNNYYKKYDIPTSRDSKDETYYETSVEVIGMISGQSAIDKMKNFVTNNKSLQFKPFIEAFNEHYNTQVRHVSNLIELELKRGIIEKLLSHLDQMIENWEDLFDMLGKDLMDDIEFSRNHLLRKHEGGKKDIFVFESSKRKKLLWEEYQQDLVGRGDNPTLSHEIAKAQYKLFCEQVSPERKFNDGKSNRKLYKKLLVSAYGSALKEKLEKELDVNVAEAISMERRIVEAKAAKESDFKDIDMSGYIQKLTNKNLPWIHTAAEKLILTKFWGVSDDSILGGVHVEGNKTTHEKFSKYEMVYLVMYHNLSITDFSKFAVRGTLTGTKIEGPYFQSYHKLMRNIEREPERFVTPHIDKRWDSPTFMPDLNASVVAQDNKGLIRGFLYGIIEGNLYKAEQDSVEYFYSKKDTRSEMITVDSKPMKVTKWLDLYRELKNNPTTVDHMIKMHNKLVEESLNVAGWNASSDEYVKLLKNPKTIKILVQMLIDESRDRKTKEDVLGIIENYGEIISEYIVRGYGETKVTSAENEIKKLKDSLVSKLGKNIDEAAVLEIKSSLG